MSTPASLRADARELRSAASTIRGQAATLGSRIPEVRRHYALPDQALWVGPNADTYAQGLTAAASDVDSVVGDADDYSTACESKAAALERQADQLEAPH